MKISLLIWLLLINLITGNCLLFKVDGMKNRPVKPSAKQCVNGRVLSPSDCNSCTCVDDGHCTKIGGCKLMGCPTEQRNSGEFCNLSLNNCVEGFKCQDVSDICDYKKYGRCLKIGHWWKDCCLLKAIKWFHFNSWLSSKSWYKFKCFIKWINLIYKSLFIFKYSGR